MQRTRLDRSRPSDSFGSEAAMNRKQTLVGGPSCYAAVTTVRFYRLALLRTPCILLFGTQSRDQVGQPPMTIPLLVEPSVAARPRADPWVALVADSLAQYAAGHTDEAFSFWHADITWTVRSAGASTVCVGPPAVLGYHERLSRLTDGTFRQEVISLEASGGPIVAAHVRTTAALSDRTLDIPSLIVIELARGRIRTVTEIPGDPVAWERFWA